MPTHAIIGTYQVRACPKRKQSKYNKNEILGTCHPLLMDAS